MNNISQNLLNSLFYANAKKTEKGSAKIDDDNNQSLKDIDTNNNNYIAKNEIQKSLLDVNGDNKISSKDLGIYTAFIQFADKYEKNANNKITEKAFDVDGDGKLDESEKAIKKAFDANNNGKIDTKMRELFDKDNKINDSVIELLKEEKNILNKKINPDNKVSNKVIDKTTNKVLSQTITDNEGITKKYTYTYHSNGDIKTKKIENSDKNITSIYTYDSDGNQTKLERNYYDENNKLTKKTIEKKADEQNPNGLKATIIYDDKEKISTKTVEDGNGTRVYSNYVDGNPTKMVSTKTENNKTIKREYKCTYDEEKDEIKKDLTRTETYTYKAFDEHGNPTKYEVICEQNGIKTKSEITQEKIAGGHDHILSTKNYQFKAGKWLLVSTIETEKRTEQNVVKEGTKRVFYFYNDENKLIKTEETFCFDKPIEAGKPVSTNASFRLSQKVITEYETCAHNTAPENRKIKSKIKYKKETIGDETKYVAYTTTYNSNGKKIKTEKTVMPTNHNTKNITAKTLITEAEKYVGYNRIDGTYSIFGTNGSACATFATYIMYQLGFNLDALEKRNTDGIRNLADNEGRYIELNNTKTYNLQNFAKQIEPGNILVRARVSESDEEGVAATGKTHTAIVKEKVYNADTNEIVVTVIGYEDNSSEDGVCERVYRITQDTNGKIIIKNPNGNDKEYEYIGFCDFITNKEE